MRTTFLSLLGFLAVAATAAPVTLVENGVARAIIVVPDGSKNPSAADLRDYVAKSTGARLEIVEEGKLASAAGKSHRVFIGPTIAAKRVVDLSKLQPEGFVIKTDGDDLFIVGRDATEAGAPVDGTFYGVCEFLERYVGVRWLMPGPVGEVVPRQTTLRVADANLRQEPLIWQRKIREVRTTGHRVHMLELLKAWGVSTEKWDETFSHAVMDPWFDHQRLGSRVSLQFGHSYEGWWDRYHAQYPDIFALQPNGTRINTNVRERLCISNPTLWDLVAKDRIAQLRENPKTSGVSIAPNDGGGGNKFCSCERCRSWDSAEAQAMYQKNPKVNPGPGGEGPFPPLSDRFFRYFNEVARRVKAEVPDRYLGTLAYSLYRSPPKGIDHLEDNIVVGYVGPNTMMSDTQRASARKDFAEWSTKAKQMHMRPNLLGNGLGMPLVYVPKLADDIRFFVERGMRLTDYASCFGNWGTYGLNYYVLAKLLWDPMQPVDPIIDDYCRAAYGPGAKAMKEYYRRTEELTDRIAATSPASPEDNTFTDFFTDEVLAQLRAPLDEASQAIGQSDPAALERVRMLKTGLDCARQTRRLMRAAADVREGKATREQFAKVEAEVIPYYKSLVLDFAVATEQNYRKIKMGLTLRPGGRKRTAEDADEP